MLVSLTWRCGRAPRHIILRVKDKADRHGTGAASLKESVDCFQGGQPKDFESNITKRAPSIQPSLSL